MPEIAELVGPGLKMALDKLAATVHRTSLVHELVVAPARHDAFAGRLVCAGESPCRPGWATMEAEMAAHAKRIEIAPSDRPVLEKWANARATERRLVDRARIVLLAGRPSGGRDRRADRVRIETAKRWRRRYEREGLDGLRDLPKSGRPLARSQRACQVDRAGVHPPAGYRAGRAPGALSWPPRWACRSPRRTSSFAVSTSART